MKIAKINLDTWRSSGRVYMDCSLKEFDEDVRKKYGVEIENLEDGANGVAAGCFCDGLNYQPWLLWISNEAGVGELAHECFHAVSGLLRNRGVTLNQGSEEAYCYTLTQIIDQLYEFIDKQHRRKSARRKKTKRVRS